MNKPSTHVSRLMKATREDVYDALTNARAIIKWKFPDDMAIKVHTFENFEGGAFRVSLTYTDKNRKGKSAAHTDTYHGHFIKLLPGKMVVEEEEFETEDPALQGKMTATITLTKVNGGTLVEASHTGLPSGLSPKDNEMGWKMSLAKLARFVER